MKYIRRCVLILVLFLAACKSDDPIPVNKTRIEDIVTSGTWRITYFYNTDKLETSNYKGFYFTFGRTDRQASGRWTLTATNAPLYTPFYPEWAETYTGSWSITDSNSYNDSLDDLHFNIVFTLSPAFEELSDDWDILDATETKIQLTDISGVAGGTYAFLTFEKN